MTTSATASGLEGVVVADTVLSGVDGERGRLVVRGHDVESLAGAASFEEVCGLLWTGSRGEGPALAAALGEARARAHARLAALTPALAVADGMDALRGALGQLTLPADLDPAAERVEVTAALGVYAAAWARLRVDAAPLAPDPTRGHAADLLRLMRGDEPDPVQAAALDAYLVTVVDHGFNASTFTARVVASTGADAVSAVVAAVGALKGPLHGGAPGPVLDMLDGVGAPERAEAWLEAELAAGRRIMGFGHRVYRVRDPRAAVLEGQVARLEEAGLATPRLALARALERTAAEVLRRHKPDRPLAANVEFYTAVLLDALGIDRSAFSPVFAAARVAGWLAHVAEQRASGRLMRPRARYAGPSPE